MIFWKDSLSTDALRIPQNMQHLISRKFLTTFAEGSMRQKLIKAKAFAASSHEFDQSIFCTLSDNQQTFWSSAGSPSQDANEFLVYELP